MWLSRTLGNRKPGLGASIDWGHPLAYGLVGFFPMNEGYGSVTTDIVGGVVGTFSGTGSPGDPRWNIDQFVTTGAQNAGPSNYIGINGGNATSFIDCGTPKSLADIYLGPAKRCSWLVRYRYANATNQGNLIRRNDNNTVNAGYEIGSPTSLSLRLVVEHASTNFEQDCTPNPTATAGGWHTLVVTFDNAAGNAIFYIDGRLVASTNTHAGSGIQGSDAPQHLYLGGAGFATGTFLLGDLDVAGFWKDRLLSADEALMLTQGPYDLLRPRIYRRFFLASSSGPQTVTVPFLASQQICYTPGLAYQFSNLYSQVYTPILAQ